MTETDSTKLPLTIPDKFIPYLDKYRIYRMFKNMVQDLIIDLPKDPVLYFKKLLVNQSHRKVDATNIMVLVSPNLKIDIQTLARKLYKSFGSFVIKRNYVIEKAEKDVEYDQCLSPQLMSKATRVLLSSNAVAETGWLMYDHPCSLREAKCLQQEGVLPNVTLVLYPITEETTPPRNNPYTPARRFNDQDFEGLKIAYKATLKEVFVDPTVGIKKIYGKCVNAIHACSIGVQGPSNGINVAGNPTAYRVVLIGPRGSGRTVQANLLANHFGLVRLDYSDIYREALLSSDELSNKLRKYGNVTQLKMELVKRRLKKKDCIDRGWVLTKYPTTDLEFELLDNQSAGKTIDQGLEVYFNETLAELRAAAGTTAVEIDASPNIDAVQTKIRAAVMNAPAFDIEPCTTRRLEKAGASFGSNYKLLHL